MKKFLFTIGIILASGVLIALGYFAKPITQRFHQIKVLVKVNNAVITEEELNREMNFLKIGEGTPFSSITKEDVLDRMINDILIINEMKKLNLSLDEGKLSIYKQQFWQGYSEDDKLKTLKENGLTLETWNELVRKRWIIEQTITKAVADQVHIGEDEVEEYYWTHLMEFYRQDRVKARQIVVETEEQSLTIKKQLNEGGDFIRLASQLSRGPEKDQGGDLGWVTVDDLPKIFTKVLFKMSEKQVSDPIATAYGYHLFYVEARERGGKIPLTEAQEQIEEKLRLEKTDKVFQTWLEDIRTQALIVFTNN